MSRKMFTPISSDTAERITYYDRKEVLLNHEDVYPLTKNMPPYKFEGAIASGGCFHPWVHNGYIPPYQGVVQIGGWNVFRYDRNDLLPYNNDWYAMVRWGNLYYLHGPFHEHLIKKSGHHLAELPPVLKGAED
ncbi:hypothetical protein JXM67_02835 [candidate division WOR-3 bacterium]|nr:hypothetical protein [candidate division WOR-3 bacterium]